jgi:hypothetical protein
MITAMVIITITMMTTIINIRTIMTIITTTHMIIPRNQPVSQPWPGFTP